MRPPLVLACIVVLGCSKPSDPVDEAKTEPAKPEPAEPEPTKAEPEPAKPEPAKPDEPAKPEPIDPSATTLLIADDEGLHEYDLAGTKRATLVTGPATMPRVLPDGRVVFLRDQGGLTLWLHAPGGKTKQVAALPQRFSSEACKLEPGTPDDDLLAVQAPGDFRLDPDASEVCLRLQDRNDNMASVGVALWVSLVDGAIRQETFLDLDGSCVSGDDPGHCIGLALERKPPPPSPASFPFAYASESGTLTGPGGVASRLCLGEGNDTCAAVEARSGSGRFELLSGKVEGEDYIYRELIVLDRQDGSLWVLSGDPPAALAITPDQVFAEHQGWLSATGESDLRWLAQDHLWIGGLLIDPATRKVLPIGGSLAFQR